MKKLTALALAALASAAVFAEGGNLRYSITVNKFENKANWHGQWELGDAWGTIFTDQLVQSGKFIVLGEADMRGAAMQEQDLAASGRTAGGNKAPKMGRMTPAQLLVKGAITHVQETKGGGGGFGFKGITLGGDAGSAEINITIYLVDSATGQVKASKSVIGKSGKKGLTLGYHGSALGGLTGDIGGFMKDNMGKAAMDACNQALEFLIGQLDSIPWEGSVSLVKADKLIINRGTREGVAVGMKFDVGKVEEVVDEDTGEVLDSEMTKIGTVTVTEVKEKICYTTPLEGAEKGMAVHPAK
jgi:curli biogenesis system outer membrane secretion channel CsgG